MDDIYDYHTLYDWMEEHLANNFTCPDCGERTWVGYGDGHVWYRCFDCDEPTKKKEAEEGIMNIGGYITDYPVPTVPLPNCLEVRDDGERSPWQLEHEKYYRMK